MSTWVLVANSAEAKLLTSPNFRTENLVLVGEYSHPDSRKKISDLLSDKPGHFKTDGGARSAYDKGDPKKVEVEHFAQELIKQLKAHCDFDKIKTLVIVAPPHVYSLIDNHLHAHHNLLDKLVHIGKDYTKYSLPDLNKSLREHLYK